MPSYLLNQAASCPKPILFVILERRVLFNLYQSPSALLTVPPLRKEPFCCYIPFLESQCLQWLALNSPNPLAYHQSISYDIQELTEKQGSYYLRTHETPGAQIMTLLSNSWTIKFCWEGWRRLLQTLLLQTLSNHPSMCHFPCLRRFLLIHLLGRVLSSVVSLSKCLQQPELNQTKARNLLAGS